MSFEANCNCAVQNKKRKEGLIPSLRKGGEVEQRRLAPIIADSNYFVNTSATLFHRRPREKLAFQRSRRNRVDCGIEERVERRIPAIHSRARKKGKKKKKTIAFGEAIVEALPRRFTDARSNEIQKVRDRGFISPTGGLNRGKSWAESGRGTNRYGIGRHPFLRSKYIKEISIGVCSSVVKVYFNFPMRNLRDEFSLFFFFILQRNFELIERR